MTQGLRDALVRLETEGLLARVPAQVDWRYEAAALLWKTQQGPALLMERVRDYPDVSLVGNMVTSRRKVAAALGILESELQPRLVAAVDRPIAPQIVSDGPCQEVTPDTVDLLRDLPVPLISAKDGGRYISAGVVVTRDPDSGQSNICIQRICVNGPDRAAIYMAPTHNWGFLARYRELGRPMPVAICIGVHPAVQVASQMLVPMDELEVAGGILGEPLRLVQCKTVDLAVPAEAEIVIEGVIHPGETVLEGPFGEFPGTYAPVRPNPVIRIQHVTMRRQPLFQMITGGRHIEHLLSGGLAREATLFRAVRAAVPSVKAVTLPEGGVCRFHAVVAFKKRTEGEGKLAVLAAFANQDMLKHVIAVDDDIDPTDPTQVQWAMATRMRADRDVFIIPGVKSNPVDPTAENRTVAKMGIDATLQLDAPPEQRETATPPIEMLAAVERDWRTYKIES